MRGMNEEGMEWEVSGEGGKVVGKGEGQGKVRRHGQLFISFS